MLFVNDVLVVEEKDRGIAAQVLKFYLTTERLVLLREDNEIMNEHELNHILTNMLGTTKLTAIRSNTLLRNFREELHNYILKVSEYIEDTRETEDFTTVMTSFVQVTEALLEFAAVAHFLQKELIDQQKIQDITKKALEQAEVANFEYILDLLEYELLPILHHFINETNEEM